MTTKTVLVTGASGFIAAHVVDLLLRRGYTVHGTVRSLKNLDKVDPLLRLPGAPERLKLFEADLTKSGSFQQAISGCSGVFHTASPFFFAGVQHEQDANEKLITPAVEGTRQVLQACVDAGIRRVVLTSSMAAIAALSPEKSAAVQAVGDGMDEECWSDVDWLRSRQMWYPLSKTLAERTAWTDFADQGLIDLRVINPTLVIGPLLTTHLNTSHEMVLDHLTGTKSVIANGAVGLVDVRDVALAHVLAFEKDDAHGRYLLAAVSWHWQQICEKLRECVGTDSEMAKKMPSAIVGESGPAFEKASPTRFSNKKARALGIEFSDVVTSLQATVDALRQQGRL